MRILSLQSSVVYGHVGNSAAVFPLQRLGHEVIAVPTVLFSNHTGYGAWRGRVLSAEDVHDLVLGVEERGALTDVDLVLSGYQGSPAIAEVILDAVGRVKRANPAAVYACDPVLGNARSGCFVDPALPVLIRDRVVPAADLVTPNQFELARLTDAVPDTGRCNLDEILDAATLLLGRGPRTVLVTSVDRHDQPGGTIEMVVATSTGAWLVGTPRLGFVANGSGDVTAALFSAHLHASGNPAAALGRTAASVFGMLDATFRAGAAELLLVESQDVLVDPRTQFEVVQVR